MSTVFNNGELLQPPSINGFELRGIKIDVFRALREEALSRNPEKEFWNMGCFSANVLTSLAMDWRNDGTAAWRTAGTNNQHIGALEQMDISPAPSTQICG